MKKVFLLALLAIGFGGTGNCSSSVLDQVPENPSVYVRKCPKYKEAFYKEMDRRVGLKALVGSVALYGTWIFVETTLESNPYLKTLGGLMAIGGFIGMDALNYPSLKAPISHPLPTDIEANNQTQGPRLLRSTYRPSASSTPMIDSSLRESRFR